MATWNIQPSYKKSIVERIHYCKDGKTIIEETGWRWGEFTCYTEDDTPPSIEEGDDLYDCGYDVQMEYCDDGCWTEYEFEGFTEEEEEKMQEWLEENSIFDLEGEGWYSSDTEMLITCEPVIELVSETDE